LHACVGKSEFARAASATPFYSTVLGLGIERQRKPFRRFRRSNHAEHQAGLLASEQLAHPILQRPRACLEFRTRSGEQQRQLSDRVAHERLLVGVNAESGPMKLVRCSRQNDVRASGDTEFTITFRKGTGNADSSASVVGSVSRWASTHATMSSCFIGNQPHEPDIARFPASSESSKRRA
jgi:hypothetical protein